MSAEILANSHEDPVYWIRFNPDRPFYRNAITLGGSHYIGFESWSLRAISESLTWRQLTGPSPFTVSPTDHEFLVEILYSVRGGLDHTIVIPRFLVTTTPKIFTVGESQVQNASPDYVGVRISINAAGTQLTAELSSNLAANAISRWSLVSVHAR